MGECVCGHDETEHHTSWFVGTGAKLVEECEDPAEETLPFDEQCMQFRAQPIEREK